LKLKKSTDHFEFCLSSGAKRDACMAFLRAARFSAKAAFPTSAAKGAELGAKAGKTIVWKVFFQRSAHGLFGGVEPCGDCLSAAL
jgi:hypothetical protein